MGSQYGVWCMVYGLFVDLFVSTEELYLYARYGGRYRGRYRGGG